MYHARGLTMDTTHNSLSDSLNEKSLQDNKCARKAWVQPTVIEMSVRNTFAGSGICFDADGAAPDELCTE